MFIGLDKELVRAATTLASINEENFMAMPIPITFDGKSEEAYTISLRDDEEKIKVEISEEQKEYLKLTKDAIIMGCFIKDGEDYDSIVKYNVPKKKKKKQKKSYGKKK